ncbi:MAG: carbohydrate binding family 9 domain-containing protein [Gemmatimonadetes bacterium]|nr:carbohydrate binding family 9 domain-containing protein [Gemmatimonadota bacterium]
MTHRSIPLRAPILLTAALLVAGAPLPTGAHAQQNPVDGNGASPPAPAPGIATAARTDAPPVIDGVPNDAAWVAATPLADFTQREPADGQPASEPTEVRILFDQDAVYVAVWAYDSRADAIVPGESIRDYEVTDADAVIMVFDTYNDQQNGFVFGTTPAGIEYDGQVASQGSGGGFFLGGGMNNQRRFQRGAGGGFNKNWDGSWTVATSRDAEGWYAEFRIPFSTLRYGSETDTWGFNVSRRIRRLNEEDFWAAVPREFGLYRLDFAGQLTGVEPPFRRSATVTPYVLGASTRDYADASQTGFGRQAEFGGEAKVQVTQGLTLDMTVNTDFAQVEVDDQQVNLTRFSLLFPEKRPFFLENAGFFTVGAGGADLFFSRRIGISGGQPVPITGGGRLSGRVAGLNLGLLHIETGANEVGDPENVYSVARVAKELPNRSRVGGLFVNRAGNLAGDYNRTWAVDGSLGLGDQLTLTSFVARTDTPDLEGADAAWNVTASWSSRRFTANATVREIGEDFKPEVGFLPRNGHRYYQVFGMWTHRPASVFREIRPHISYFTYRTMRTGVDNGFNESARWHIDSHWQWHSGMELHTGANYVTEGLYESFAIPGTDVVVPNGTYAGWESQIVFFTDQSRPVALNTRFNWGAFLSGSKRTTTADLTLRRGARTSAGLRVSYNDVMLPQGDFTATLAGVNLGYFFTPRIYLQSLIQYSDQIDTWSANIRFGWLNTAGTGLFIVYNEVQGIETLTGPLGRSVYLKFTRQLNVFGG